VVDLKGQGDMVTFLKSDFTRGKPVWIEPGTTATPSAQQSPAVDPVGEWVAWTLTRNGTPFIAIKPVNQNASAPPSLLGTQFPAAYFCDWTEQGEILANVPDGAKWKLVVMDTDGQVRRTLSTAIAPAEGVSASWRKYGHR
jgi:hypothetical protein